MLAVPLLLLMTAQPDQVDQVGQTTHLATSASPAHKENAPVPVAEPEDAVQVLSAQRLAAEADHLRRLGIWGGASVVGGAALLVTSQPGVLPGGPVLPELQGLGVQSVAWGSINLAITGIGALTQKDPVSDRDEALAAEDLWAKVLLVNVGLDVGYMMAGSALVAASYFGVERPLDWRSHGVGIMGQGLGLLVLDIIALAGSAERERALADVGRP